MQCHSAIKTDSPSIQKLAVFAKNDRDIQLGARVPDSSYVNFSHSPHVQAGNTCAECHGEVADARSTLSRGRHLHGRLYELPPSKESQYRLHLLP